jgi:hypothetical protein
MVRDRSLRLLPLLAGVGVASCAAPVVEPAKPPVNGATPAAAPAAAPADPLALIASSGGPGAQAALIGKLVLEDGCLYVVAAGGERWIPVFGFPATRWNAAELRVEIAGGSSYRVGDTVRLGGGTIVPLEWARPLPVGSRGDKYWRVAEPFISQPR